MSKIVSGWYFDFSWYLRLDRSIYHLIYITRLWILRTYEVRLLLVYTYEYFFGNFFVQFNKKTPLSPPPSTPRTKRHLMCNDEKVSVAKPGIYIHNVCAARAEIQGGVFFIVGSRLSEPQWPLKIRRHGHFKGVLVLVIYHLVALVLRVRTQAVSYTHLTLPTIYSV